MDITILYRAISDIKLAKVKGASNIAKYSLNKVKEFLETVDNRELRENKNEILDTLEKLKFARPTEPMTRNLLDLVEEMIKKEYEKEYILEKIDNMIKFVDETLEKVTDVCANLIEDDMIILTHCKSSTVINSLIKAKKQGKEFIVYNTETRPLWQGRETAKILVENEIKVVHFVDFAVGRYIRDADIILVGADSILADGDLINKVGTYIIAILADKFDIPLYSVSTLLKYNSKSVLGKKEVIEERSPYEVWGFEHPNLTVKNPAFDLVPAEYIRAYVTEMGIIAPQNIRDYGRVFIEKLREMFLTREVKEIE